MNTPQAAQAHVNAEAQARRYSLLFFPFAILSVAFIILYSLVNWVFFIQLEVFPIKENMINDLIPFLVSAALILIWIRPRAELIEEKYHDFKPRSLFQFVAIMILPIPVITAQYYLRASSGDYIHLISIEEMHSHPHAKYYTLDHYYLDWKNYGLQTSLSKQGRSRNTYTMGANFVLPLRDHPEDTLLSTCQAWVGFQYSQTLVEGSPTKREAALRNFAVESARDLKGQSTRPFVYLNRVGNSSAGDLFQEAIKASPVTNSAYTPVFFAEYGPLEDRTHGLLGWTLFALLFINLVWFLMVRAARLDPAELTRFDKGHPPAENEFRDFFIALKPRPGFIATPVLFYVNVLVFLAMVVAGLGFVYFRGEDLYNWGANFSPATKDGQWWRLLSCTFLHGGISHLFSNMIGLLYVGQPLERILGTARFLVLYLMMGILASLASLEWHDVVLGVGASGAIFGMYGVLIALLLTKFFPPPMAKSFLVGTLVFVGFSLLMGLAGGADNAAHVGGLICGFVIGLIIKILKRRS